MKGYKTNYERFLENEESKEWCIGVAVAAVVLPALVLIISVLTKIF